MFEKISQVWMNWSVKTFTMATSYSSLQKLEVEIAELKFAIVYSGKKFVLDEYADCFLCLLHSAAKEGFTVQELTRAIGLKAGINFRREWILNEDGNTYIHKK